MHNQVRFAMILLLLFVASISSAATPDEAALAITDNYRITTFGFFGDFKEIGNVLMPRREGLRANRPSKTFKPNVIKNHQLTEAGGGDLSLGNAHSGALKPGERLYLYGVSTGEDFVQLDLHTVAAYVVPGIKGATPLQASVRFQYDDGLKAVNSKHILEDIGKWLDIQEDSRPASRKSRPAITPPATDKPAVTVRLGQTTEEVSAILGVPAKQILLGAKTIYIYHNFKVIFVNGKVTDAE